MPNSPHSSTPSPGCRLEWRPSHQEQAALLLLTVLGTFSLLNCDLPALLAWPAAGIAVAWGILCLRQNGKRPLLEFLIASDIKACRLNGQLLSQLDLRWRGPLLFVRWKYPARHRWHHTVFWPDTLPAVKRRELRLAAPAAQSADRHLERALETNPPPVASLHHARHPP